MILHLPPEDLRSIRGALLIDQGVQPKEQQLFSIAKW
jgi:hypothetical protein